MFISRHINLPAAALVLAACVCARAENLVSVKSGMLPPVPARIEHLVTIDGVPVALGSGGAWALSANRDAWSHLEARAPATVLASASDGRSAFVLMGAPPRGLVESVARLSLDGGTLVARELPALPMPLARALAAVRADTLYVAGFDAAGAAHLIATVHSSPSPVWTELPAWPLTRAPMTSIAAQAHAVYLTFAGGPGRGDRMVRWRAGEGWSERDAVPGRLVAGFAAPIGQAHVLYGVVPDAKGEDARLMMFHTITGSWAALAAADAAGSRTATGWENGAAWSDGTRVAFAQVESGKLMLAWLDWVVIVVYLVSMLGMGLYFYLREKRRSTADFFVGGRTIPFWAAGVSLYAANTSSISYIAIPAKAFETNWQYLTNNLIAVVGLMFVAVWIVPLLRRLDLMSVFSYLETRFHRVIRTLASALFMAVQIGSRMSVILFLPSLAIATITGIPMTWSILIMGVFTMVYTALGGMKAVVWTDIVQLVVKMGGIAFAIGFVVYMLDGGAGELLSIARAEQKMKLFDFSFDLTKATVWGFLFLVLFDVVLTFPKDQVLMQRVLSTANDRDAGRSIWTFAAIMIPGGFMFYFVGTALYAFYKTHPERMNPLLAIDATFPLFIAAELPMGVRGLIIAGILAAAMATLSSIMNSVATLASVDFYEKIVKNPDPKVSVRFAEAMTVVTGILGMGVALVLSRYDIHSLFDVSIELAGLLGGGFAGAYTLGMFTRRANWQGVCIGVACSITLTTLAWSMDLVHPYFYLAISILLTIVIGYAASWLFPAPDAKALEGLTIYGKRKASGRAGT